MLEQEFRIELKFFALTLKITDLSEIFVNHYNICCQIMLAIRDYDATLLLLCLVKLTVKPYSCAVACTNLLFIVQNVQEMARNGGPMNQTQASFLDHSSS